LRRLADHSLYGMATKLYLPIEKCGQLRRGATG
jgi:hypothetical protein